MFTHHPDEETQLQHIRMGAKLRRDVLKLVVGDIPSAKLNPTLSRLKMLQI